MRARGGALVALALAWQLAKATGTAVGSAAHQLGDVSRAVNLVAQANGIDNAGLAVNNDSVEAWHRLGAVAYHEGRFHEAQTYLERAILVAPSMELSGLTHCNLAETLRKLHRPQDGLTHGLVCLNLTDGSEFSLLVLAWLYKDLDESAKAMDALQRVLTLNSQHLEAWDTLGTIYLEQSDAVSAIDLATLLPQVYTSQEHLDSTRKDMHAALDALLAASLDVENPEAVGTKTKLAKVHSNSCAALHFEAPHTRVGVGSLIAFDSTPRRLHVGFMSKFFVSNHAHGMLLRGVLQHLNRKLFHVTLVVVPDPQQPVDSAMAAAADDIKVLSMHLAHCQQEEVPAICLISTFACIEGIPTVDYFISADVMESSPDPAVDAHYSEQVVLLSGLGICVLAEILTRDPHGHLVLLEARYAYGIHYNDVSCVTACRRGSLWTQQFQTRLRSAMYNATDLWSRVHFLPRVGGSAPFLKLLSVADVVLHPFPFGGSKTSADALLLGLPLVAMKTPFLRCRMAYSFYKHMGLLELVATTVDEYVAIALKLGTDAAHRNEVRIFCPFLHRKHSS
ncbi:hypothetical protein DYB32_008135 [Aphanomyces invadans]|uniref:protein O-GlcNAc transferase n=1 Tax=Aphanomyces invadans TaxID=157072 RepID=A0A3R6Y3Q3_9STRA|nr:hypothetical protein DYB32_008135 [Aphanomyces invadans]